MNTKALSNCYDTLTARERLPLILAATARGDEVERDRLVRSAPRVVYSVSNYMGLADAFDTVRMFHLLELLATAADYLLTYWLADTDDDEFSRRMLDCAFLHGYLFKAKLEAWRLFCGEHGFNAEDSWKPLPGNDTVRRAEQLAEHAAFSSEVATAYLKRLGRENLEPPTAACIAADLGEALKDRVELWE